MDHNFNIAKVARYGEKDVNCLLNDPGIIRNRLKINAAIVNAQKILELPKGFGSFRNWLRSHAAQLNIAGVITGDTSIF